MARLRSSYLNELTTADLKQLLEARQRIDILEKEKARLARELSAVETELERLVAGVEKPARAAAAAEAPAATPRRKKVGKKVARKKATKKAAGKATKKAPGKATKKAAVRKDAPKTGQPKLEDIVLGILKKKGGPVAYQDILGAIIKGNLFVSRSKNFDNVLRRTLSTSELVKRAGRGLYVAA